jgi:hypothetical protein
MDVAGRVIAGIAGVVVIVSVLDAAIRTFVLPRGTVVSLTRVISRGVYNVFRLVMRPMSTYESRDRVLALYAPVALLVLPASFLVGLLFGFAGLYHAVLDAPFSTALRESGSALFTLGFATPVSTGATLLVYAEAGLGLALLALLISYLPTMYGAFSRREVSVSELSVRAGTPPTPASWLVRAFKTGFNPRFPEVWEHWELWFVELEETHTSLAFLNFFRSPDPQRSWVTATGTVLDTAALHISLVDAPYSPEAAVCVRSGYLALRSIARFFGIPFDPDPAPDDPISIDRSEFDEVAAQLEAGGVPLKADRDQAWRDFRGWRVNYDSVLLAIAGFLSSPYGLWSSDRSPVRVHRPPIGRRARVAFRAPR